MLKNNSKHSVKHWKVISSKIALNEEWLRVRQDRVQLPNGEVMDDYFVWESPDYVTMVPLTEDGKFVVVQQYQHAIGRIIYQFPGGIIDVGERPGQAATRELLEETGFSANEIMHLGDVTLNGTKVTGWVHIFMAKNVVKVAEPVNDATEQIKIVLVSPAELLQLIETNQFHVADSLSGAFLAIRHLGLNII